jgi:hypothetical protein
MIATQLIGDIPTASLKQDYIRIENFSQYKQKIKRINPLDEDYYIEYWTGIKKKVVEGMWGQESKGYRYCPPALYFYTNFGFIQDTDKSGNTTYIIPLIQDLEWEINYMLLEAEGFSGFYGDDEYTSDRLILEWEKDRTPQDFEERQLFKLNGDLKKYMPARENLRRLHEFPKGQPLYANQASNAMIVGSRSGGKSYTAGLAKALHAICIDGALYYKAGSYFRTPEYLDKDVLDKDIIVEVTLGSGDTDKSSELFKKIEDAMNALATRAEFGVWGDTDEDDYMPCPLYKDMTGSIASGNKKNAWRHEYKVMKDGKEIKKGSKSKITHVTYSEQKGKGKGAQAAAGGRVKFAITEEVGLTPLVIEAFGSNVNIVSRNGRQFGVQLFIGTSGNIDTVQPTKKMFNNPQDYNILSYKDVWENMGKDGQIAFFLPNYMVLRQYKDEDGNTIYQKAFEHVYKERAMRAKSSDPSVLRTYKMNNPIVPSEMWLNMKGHYLPHAEAVEREKELLKDNKYLQLAQPVSLVWNQSHANGVKYEIDHTAEPFFTYPLQSTLMSFDSSVVLYDVPKTGTPQDFYFATLDPYRAENIDKGGSFGALHMFINPKYWEEYMPDTGPLVATYIAKPMQGLDFFYKQIEKLLALYNNPVRGLAYEANQGADCKNYYINKGKERLLVLRPQLFDNKKVFASRVTEYGYWTTDVVKDLTRLNDFLLLPLTKLNQKKVIETIPCLFTIQQIIQYDLKDNFDAVSSLTMAPIFKGVQDQERDLEAVNKRNKNELKFLSTNPLLHNENNNRSYARKATPWSQ